MKDPSTMTVLQRTEYTLDRVRALPDRWRRLRAQFEQEYEIAAQGGSEWGQSVAQNKMTGLDACLTDLEETLK